MLIKYTTVDRIFYEINKIKPDGFNEIDIIDWIGEALDLIGVTRLYEEAICYANVSNFQTLMPEYAHNIIQIVRDNQHETLATNSFCGTIPTETTTEDTEEDEEESNETDCCNPSVPSCYYIPQGENNPVLVNQLGEPLTEYDLAFYRPFLNTDDFLNYSLSSVIGRFSPVRLATNSFFNTIVCEDKDTPYENCTDEYTIISGRILRFSFEEGGVLISFLKQKIDAETGYPLIPENTLITKAIIQYVRMKFAEDDFYSYKQGSEQRFQKAESDWQWYCGQASNALKMPYSVDEWQNLLEQRNYLIPRNHYYGYFGHLGRPEKRNFFNS